MHENTSISNQPQTSPGAWDGKAGHSPQRHDLETELNEKLPIQLKLSVGTANDPLEYEADAVADKVMRMPEKSFIQRKAGCSCSDYDDEHVRLKPLASQIRPFIQAKGDGSDVVSSSVSSRIQSSMGGGSPMQGDTKSFMENRFGTDFSDVKIHSGGESAELNRSLNAKAFTVSNNIYFNSGQYQPETDSGKHLLAHELTHVVQQNGSKAGGMIRRKSIDDFKTDLEAISNDHKKVIEELFKHPKFVPLVNYVRKCPSGTIDFRVKRLTQMINGKAVDLFGGFGGSDLTVNPMRPEHASNPLEMVDTIVHELIHAILDKNSICTSASNPFPLAAGIQDRGSDPELQALQAGASGDIFDRKEAAKLSAAGSKTASGMDVRDYFNKNYGPSASRPETHYIDLNKEGLTFVVSIIADIKKALPAIGKETVSFDNVELFKGESLVTSVNWVSPAQHDASKKLFKDRVAGERKIDPSTFTDQEYDISAIQVVEFADSMIFDENTDSHWGVSGGVWQCSKRSRFTGKDLHSYVTGAKSKTPGKGTAYKLIQHT